MLWAEALREIVLNLLDHIFQSPIKYPQCRADDLCKKEEFYRTTYAFGFVLTKIMYGITA